VTIRALFAALPALALFLAPVAVEAKAKKDTTVTCKDGTTDKAGRGACSGHGGVDKAATQAAKAKAEPAAAAAATEKAATPKKEKKAKKAKAEAAAPTGAAAVPAAATTVTCKDGTTDTAGRGACSGHGGVDKGTKKSKKAKAAAAEAAAPAAAPAPSAAPAPAPAPRAAAPARPAAPAGEKGPPTAKCKDGTLSYAEHHTGACSNHGGVAEWLDGSKK